MPELKHELDPTIWSNIPHDILLNIIEHSDLPTQVKWSCTSRELFPFASCKIWASLRLLSSEIVAYVLNVSGQRAPDRTDGIVHFLLESAYRRHNKWNHVITRDHTGGMFIHRPNGVEEYDRLEQLTATLPISRIKDLEIDNQGFDRQHPICNQFDMDQVLPFLLERLPTLQSFRYLGPLSAKSLAAIIQVDRLTVLQLRNSSDVLKFPTWRLFIMPWRDPMLDWRVLANLKGLQELEVGRLTSNEARGLAEGIAFLKLRKLHLSCWGWEYENQVPNSFPRSPLYTSPLVVFLYALVAFDVRGDQTSSGLPPTLKNLGLSDKYHVWIPSYHELLASAISTCDDLKTLSMTISVSRRCYDTMCGLGLPFHLKTIGIGSWQQLSCEEEMHILHQFRGPRGEVLQTSPYYESPCNIVKTLDQVIAAGEGPGNHRISTQFVRDGQFRSDEIIIYVRKEIHGPSAAEGGSQAQDASMVAEFGSQTLGRGKWKRVAGKVKSLFRKMRFKRLMPSFKRGQGGWSFLR